VTGIGLSAHLALFVLLNWLAGGAAGTGFIILIATSFPGGIKLSGVGLPGEYIARICYEVQCRPAYVVDRVEDGGQDRRDCGLCQPDTEILRQCNGAFGIARPGMWHSRPGCVD
jgi:hypothetical protein